VKKYGIESEPPKISLSPLSKEGNSQSRKEQFPNTEGQNSTFLDYSPFEKGDEGDFAEQLIHGCAHASLSAGFVSLRLSQL
jgi:hypothetical protein